MVSHPEAVIYANLAEIDGIEKMALAGLPLEVIPTEDMRRVVDWCLDYYHRTGRLQAPSRDAILTEWRDVIEDKEIDLGDGTETDDVYWAVEALKSQHIYVNGERWNLGFGTALAKADPQDRLDVLDTHARELYRIVLSLQDRTQSVEIAAGLTDALRDYEARVARGGVLEGIQFGLPEIDGHFFGIHPGELGVLGGVPKVGKATTESSRVLTPQGWRAVGELRPGDQVIGSNGWPTTVLGTQRWSDRPLLRVTVDDGGTVVVDAEHEWTVHPHQPRPTTRTHSTAELAEIIQTDRRYAYLPLVGSVQYAPGPELPLDPYLLGVLLGDGCLTQATPTVNKPEPWLHDEVIRLLPEGDEHHWLERQRGFASIVGGRTTAALRGLGVMGLHSWEKVVPERYMRADVAARRSLLAGLLDTDGGVDGKGITFCSTSQTLARQVQELVWSLGGTARLKSKIPTYQGGEGRRAYVVRLRLDELPFRLPRKRWDYETRPAVAARPPSRRIVEITPAGVGDTVCIQVAAADGLYVTEDYLVTHNSFFALWVAWFNYRYLHQVVCLYTIEVSVKDTYNRLACMATGIDYRDFQRGEVPQEIIDTRIVPLVEQLRANDGDDGDGGKMIVIQPEPGRRDPLSLVRNAQLFGSTVLIIDQLTFVEPPEADQRNRSRADEVRDTMRMIKILISASPNPIPCLLLHQVNREGQKAADRAGRLEMYHMADGSEVERAADLVVGLYQNGDDEMFDHVKFQSLAARRADLLHWNLHYRPWAGAVSVLGQVTFA